MEGATHDLQAAAPELDREFAAVVFTAGPGRAASFVDGHSGSSALRRRIDALSVTGTHVAVIGSPPVAELDDRLRVRPRGPGRLLLAGGDGAQLAEITNGGVRPLHDRRPTPAEDEALDRAIDTLEGSLAAAGVGCRASAPEAGRRSIDLTANGDGKLRDVASLARRIAAQAGLDAARVRVDGERIDIALTDAGDALTAVLDQWASIGVGAGLVLVIGDFGCTGRDEPLLVPRLQRAVVVSVGEARTPSSTGVVEVGGGATGLRSVLAEVLARRAACRVPSIDPDPAWVITEPSGDPHRQRVSESVLTLACGGVGTRGSVEEGGPGSVPLTVTAGVYKGVGAEQQLAAAPHWTTVQFAPPPATDVRHLDLRTGVLLRAEQDADGVPLRTARIASQTTPGLMLMRVECAPQRMTPGPALRGSAAATTLRGRNGTWRGTTAGEANTAVHAVATQRERRGRRFHVLDRFAVYSSGRQEGRSPDAGVDAAALPRQLLEAADQLGFDRLLAENRAAWARRWDAVDVRIPADPATQLAARFALFQLWSHSGRHDELALGARGLTGPGYAGHVFWDSDVFVLPALCSIDPAAARAIMTYRHSRLAAARARAASLGAPGARFPWESAATGEDVTPTEGRLGGRAVAVRTGSLEEHITADVAWAAAFCCEWTGRPLRAESAEGELLLETARYWAHRIRRDPGGAGHIEAVTGPDEYHENVDDDAYTNVMARWNLRAAAGLAQTAEGAAWHDLADALVDGYDARSGRYEQFSGYFGLEPLQIAEFATPPVAADVLLGPERLAASQVIKQPDVLMLHHLVPAETAPGSLATNLDFYGPRTAHGSSLSPAITASLLTRAGRPDEALDMLRIALWLDLEDRTHMTAAGLHLATIGGVWQALLFGFAGARISEGGLVLDPRLPAAWPELEIRFLALGRRVRLRIDGGVRVWSDGPLPVRLAGDDEVQLPGGREVHLGALPSRREQQDVSEPDGGLP